MTPGTDRGRVALLATRPQLSYSNASMRGVTRERIRQIEAKTLAKLRAYRAARGLRGFLD